MSDATVLVETCTEWGHPSGKHKHVVFGDLCEHGTPGRYTCHGCENGIPAAPAATTALPVDWTTRGVTLPRTGGRDAFVAPSAIVGLIQGRYVGGSHRLGQAAAEALIQAGWAESTYRGHRASYALRRMA